MTVKKQIIQAPFTNDFGTVNVGDLVMAVTTGYSHNVSVYKAKYLGYIESDDSWNGTKQKKVKLEVQEIGREWYYKGTEKKWSWKDGSFSAQKDNLELREFPYTRNATLQLNRIAPIKQSDITLIETVGKLV